MVSLYNLPCVVSVEHKGYLPWTHRDFSPLVLTSGAWPGIAMLIVHASPNSLSCWIMAAPSS